MNELNEARAAHAAAQAEHAEASAAYSSLYTALQIARSEHRDVEALDLQGKLNVALQRRTLAEQMVQGHQARLRVFERRALEALKRDLVKDYAVQARAIALRLAELMTIDQRLGIPAFDSAGLGGFRVPSYGDLKADDSGALYCFLSLSSLLPEAEKLIDSKMKGTDHVEASVAT